MLALVLIGFQFIGIPADADNSKSLYSNQITAQIFSGSNQEAFTNIPSTNALKIALTKALKSDEEIRFLLPPRKPPFYIPIDNRKR
jgi:hypothetical protein